MQRAVALMGKNTLQRLGEGEDVVIQATDEEGEAPAFGVGAIVAMVEATSTPRQLRIILGKVLRLEAATREVLLAHPSQLPPKKSRDVERGFASWWDGQLGRNHMQHLCIRLT